ncbi:MAG: ATP-binding protein [Candidatus Dormibacteria bacterium]
MRVERLEVAGFGSLREVTVDFHPNLTVVLGDNESGKSTLHRAIRAALYGMDAGGQGRPVDRSDWARWAPWRQGLYGVALTYQLADGRRIRVARRLDLREQPVQVLEMGGSELTDELRRGRSVSPGRFHLGLDEAVFAATAWLGDDALGITAADGPGGRVKELQQAIERMADTGSAATAAEALRRLNDVQQRVGTEKRAGSQLGAATIRLRDLSLRLDEASRQANAVSSERQRLQDLETQAAEAAERRLDAEKRWLRGRLGDIESRLEQATTAQQELAELAATVDETSRFAEFPLELEEQAIRLGGELNHAAAASTESTERWQAAQASLDTVVRRRSEIAAGLVAVDSTPRVDAEAIGGAARLEGEVAALDAALAATRADAGADSRIEALRREIAGTGLSSIPPDSVPAIAALLRDGGGTGWRWRSWWTAAAAAVLVFGGAAGGALAIGHHLVPALVAAGVGVFVAIGLAYMGHMQGTNSSPAAGRLRDFGRGLGLDDASLEQLARRLPTLAALQAALYREEARVESRKAESAALQATAAALAERCAALAAAADGSDPEPVRAGTTEALLRQAKATLSGVTELGRLHDRRRELEEEDRTLEAKEHGLQALESAAKRQSETVVGMERRLVQMLAGAGMTPGDSPAASVKALREAAETRRRHQAAMSALNEVQRRVWAIGKEDDLRRLLQQLWEELMRRGDDDTEGKRAPLGPAELQELERQAEHARQTATASGEQARDLRARLLVVLETLPDIADLEDERAAAAAEREQALHRRDSIALAVHLLEQASRRTHRDLAPQLAESIASRLSLLTDARYREVNVDTEHFAVSLLTDDRPDMLPLEHASHGTRDQVSLLLRLALAETLSAGIEPVPLMLDEPLLTADPRRRGAMLRFVHQLSATQQVVLTAADPRVVTLLREIAGEAAMSVVQLGDAEPIIETTGQKTRRVRVLAGDLIRSSAG